MLCTLVSKLPGGLIDSWNCKAIGIRRKHSREPSLKDFIVLVDVECGLVNDPLFYKEALKDYMDNTEQPQNIRRKVKMFSTKTDDHHEQTINDKDQCSFCKEIHD
jgi:hypothetical protein